MTRVEMKALAIVILDISVSTFCHFNTHFLVVTGLTHVMNEVLKSMEYATPMYR